jgi:small-conductance mechanosensitive channel
MRFLFTFCIGVAATLAWQAYGDTAREMIASSYPQLGWVSPSNPQLSWLSPRAAAAQPAPSATAASSTRSTDSQQLQELSLGLAAMRQRVDQLTLQVAASQDQTTRDITARVQQAQRDILDKIAATQPRQEVTAARKPPAPQASQLR